MNNRTIREQLKDRQRELGMTDYRLAKRSGLGAYSIDRYFAGHDILSVNFFKLVKALECTGVINNKLIKK